MKIPQVAAVAFSLVCLAIPACEHDHEHSHHAHHKIVVTSPIVKDVTITEQYVCQIHSRRHIKVCALEGGYIEAIPIREGQEVKKGDLLFKIVPTLYQAKLDAELAEVQLAQLEYDNTRRLFNDKVVSQQEVALHLAKLAKAQAKAKLAEAELNFAIVRAPFDGIVDRLEEQQGSLVKEEAVLTTLSDNAVMWVYFNVPEARYLEYMADRMPKYKSNTVKSDQKAKKDHNETGKLIPVTDLQPAIVTSIENKYPMCKIVKAEMKIENGQADYEIEITTAEGKKLELEINSDGIKVEANNEDPSNQSVELVLAHGGKFPYPGTIGAIEAKFNNETGNIPFRADFPNPDRLLRHGQTGNVLIHRTQTNALVIPQRATFEILNKLYVYVVDDHHMAHQREITVQHEMEDVYVIKSGLNAQERIILEGVTSGLDGQTVEFEFRGPDKVLANQKHHAE